MRTPASVARPALLLLAAGAVGCGGSDDRATTPTAGGAPAARTTTERPATTTTAPRTGDDAAGSTRRPDDPDAAARRAASLPPRSWDATCPTATPSPLGCRAVRGRVLTIQSHDPDGDGDLHVVAVGASVTGPGITVFDVRPALRPARDPREGELVTGAGPVFRGSLRQKQIQVDVFRVWRPRR